MRYLSVCSGIEAATVAWEPLGWKPIGFSEIESFPCNLLAHYYPNVPNYGDMTKLPERILRGEIDTPDLLCGGTPCQAFSVAGLRQSLDDARGNLSLIFCEIANAIDDVRYINGGEPAIVFWENVPGVLNTKDNAFGCFLAGLAGESEPLEPAGGKWTNAGYVFGPQRTVAWRVLDAQYFGVAQRRRRVFVVASARDGFDPGAVLFESEGMRRDSAPRREAGVKDSATASGSPAPCGEQRSVLTFSGNAQPDEMRFDPHVVSTLTCNQRPTVTRFSILGNIINRQPHTGANGTGFCAELAPTLTKTDRHGVVGTLTTRTGNANDNYSAECGHAIVDETCLPRWLTSTECERLQGFSDGYTLVPVKGKPIADGPRYKAIGNSWAVPNVRWIGRRIDLHLLGLL